MIIFVLFCKVAIGNSIRITSGTYTMDGERTITVVNTAGSRLPATGGCGKLPIMLTGLALLLFGLLYGECDCRRSKQLK